MQKLEKYKSIEEAKKSLDNGGRFYNFLTTADDGTISPAEIGKTAGLFNDRQKMILFLSMSLSGIPLMQKEEILKSFEKDLKDDYYQYAPKYLLPSEAEEKGNISENAVITGIPKLIESKTDFQGFIFVPIMTGKVMTMILIPIMDSYDMYHLMDQETSKIFLVTHARGKEKLSEEQISIGGTLKELRLEKNENKKRKVFLEALYYIDPIHY